MRHRGTDRDVMQRSGPPSQGGGDTGSNRWDRRTRLRLKSSVEADDGPDDRGRMVRIVSPKAHQKSPQGGDFPPRRKAVTNWKPALPTLSLGGGTLQRWAYGGGRYIFPRLDAAHLAPRPLGRGARSRCRRVGV